MTDLSVALFLFGLICCFIFVALLVINQKPANGKQADHKPQTPSSPDDYDVSDD